MWQTNQQYTKHLGNRRKNHGDKDKLTKWETKTIESNFDFMVKDDFICQRNATNCAISGTCIQCIRNCIASCRWFFYVFSYLSMELLVVWLLFFSQNTCCLDNCHNHHDFSKRFNRFCLLPLFEFIIIVRSLFYHNLRDYDIPIIFFLAFSSSLISSSLKYAIFFNFPSSICH